MLDILEAWVDDLMILVPHNMIEWAQRDLEKAFMCKHKVMENVGSKLNHSRDVTGLDEVKFTQPVIVQKLEEE